MTDSEWLSRLSGKPVSECESEGDLARLTREAEPSAFGKLVQEAIAEGGGLGRWRFLTESAARLRVRLAFREGSKQAQDAAQKLDKIQADEDKIMRLWAKKIEAAAAKKRAERLAKAQESRASAMENQRRQTVQLSESCCTIASLHMCSCRRCVGC